MINNQGIKSGASGPVVIYRQIIVYISPTFDFPERAGVPFPLQQTTIEGAQTRVRSL